MVRRVAGLILACALAGCLVIGCSSTSESSQTVAATVGEVSIYEDDITRAIEQFRADMGLEDASEWSAWLEDTGFTPESLRESYIDEQVTNAVVRVAAEERGIALGEGEIDAYVESQKEALGGDEGFNEMLEESGMSEDTYRYTVETTLLSERLQEDVEAESPYEPTDEDVMRYAETLSEGYDGAKRSSQIVLDASDAEEAARVLALIEAGELDFSEAARTYSTDSYSAQRGGDVGWDVLRGASEAYTQALAVLDVGQISGEVEDDDALYIIECTDVFTAPETLESVEDLPEDFQETALSMAQANGEQTSYSEWLDDYEAGLEVVINPMPDDLSYDVGQ